MDVADCTDDALLGGRVHVLQPARGYRVAVDAVLLAAAVPLASGERILDVGCGVGAATLCLLARAAAMGLTGVRTVGLEVQPRYAALARLNADRNGSSDAFDVITGDVATPPVLAAVDHVMTNPPYLPAAQADPSPDRGKALATVESTADLAIWLDYCLRVVRPGGTVSVVHRADRLPELIARLRPHVVDLAVLPLLPRAGAAPKRVMLRARRGTGGAILTVPGLVLHDASGGYTPQADAILRDAAPLEFAG
ncbi:MAG TPA: methyltransferase [Vineibacter sp.]|nr:methyltransferase [Vineibacter sp.]